MYMAIARLASTTPEKQLVILTGFSNIHYTSLFHSALIILRYEFALIKLHVTGLTI